MSATEPELLPHTQDIFDECSRFRVLVLGKSGAGKSSLINCAFKVDLAHVSESKPGKSNINDEIFSAEENPYFVLHDSQGFEAGETENFAIIENFIQERKNKRELRDRLHAIWLCVEIPTAGGSLFERGHERFFGLNLEHVPVVIVFTKYDKLATSVRMREIRTNSAALPKDTSDRNKHFEAHADVDFKKICIKPLTREFETKGHVHHFTKVSTKPKYGDTISELVKITRDQASEAIWLIGAIAQRASVDLNIQASIAVGRQKYWRGLASSAHFPTITLQRCLHVLHSDIIATWNMYDPEEQLRTPEFEALITNCVESEKSSSIGISKTLGIAGAVAGVTGAAAGPLAPVVAPSVFAGIMIASWVYQTYTATPVILRLLMSYIVDSINIMQSLFFLMAAQSGRPQVTVHLIDIAVRAYKESEIMETLHDEILYFSKKATIPKRDDALDAIVRLIERHRFNPPERYKEEVRGRAIT